MQQHLIVSAAAVLLGTSLPLISAQQCSVVSNVRVTFFGSPDNDPPGTANTAYNCGGRNYQAGGVGTYDNPLTFATAPGEYETCELVYAPYLRKYLRHEDYCQTCTENWQSGIAHIDVWTGIVADGGQAQIECENALTPDANQAFIRNPARGLPVDLTALWDFGTCNTQATYLNYNTRDYCSGGGSGPNPPTCQTGCEWEGHCIGCPCSSWDDCSDDFTCTNGFCARP
ncbi:hypothetical protein DL771_004433 [Monosporascus sp. 5C6A]|nr:hypothetical protein DL771_004433 [Monosporascus sp. 5C6A]